MKDERRNHKYAGNPEQARAPPRIFYHGTCWNFINDRMKTYPTYEYAPNPVFLSARPLVAVGCANERSNLYGDAPALLGIDSTFIADKPWLGSNEANLKVSEIDWEFIRKVQLPRFIQGDDTYTQRLLKAIESLNDQMHHDYGSPYVHW